MSDPTRSLPPAELSEVIGAYLEAVDEGRPPDPDELIGRYPEFATELRRFLAAEGAFAALAAPFRPPVTPGGDGAETVDASPASPHEGDGHQPPAVAAGEYALLGEVGRGGMGDVYRARDAVFGRDVAVKVLRDRFRNHPAAARRFRAEARITAELAHPGVPPVHALGALADGRPYLAMKLIDGDTLDKVLRDRPDLSSDRGRFVAVFEQVCQAVAFAHSKGIVHRDLKPANVMVGTFGETLVMDWGLAKVVRGADRDTRDDRPGDVRAAPDPVGRTETGSVLGTPAFMPPEQAAGDLDRLDERADVFGLGAVLCAILSGHPPYTGGSAEEVRARAARADLGEAFARLDACGAEPELVDLCKRCLAAERDARPRDAGAVAAAVAAYRAGVDERLRRAERDRAAAEARAAEEVNTRREAEARAAEQRKRRRVQLVLAGALGLLLLSGVAFAWYEDRQTAARRLADADRKTTEARLGGERDAEARSKTEQARRGVATNLELAADLRKQYKFKAAEAALEQAAQLAAGALELLPQVAAARRDLAFVVQLDDIRYRKWIWLEGHGEKGSFNAKSAPREYRSVFIGRGLDLTTLDPREAARRIAESAVKAELVAAVDDWALHETDEAVRSRLLEIARRADPGPWTDRLRDPALRNTHADVEKLVADAEPATASPAIISVLAHLMGWRWQLDPTALLAAARARHPTDFELAFAQGVWHVARKDGRELAPFDAARSLRPDNYAAWINLGASLKAQGDAVGAIAAYREAIRLDPKYALAHNNLGVSLKAQGDAVGAIAAYREAIRLDPKYAPAHNNLGMALKDRGDVVGAIAAYREAIRLDPKYAPAHTNLGAALADKGDVVGAVAAYREAIRIDPKYALAHSNLGIALKARGDAVGAIAAYHEALKHDPKYAPTHNNLGVALKAQGDVDGAIAAYKEALKHDPKYATAHYNLGNALRGQNDVYGARAALQEAARHDPKRYEYLLKKLPAIPVAPAPRSK